jgi:tetratricopeptide (TPR) repeat protein
MRLGVTGTTGVLLLSFLVTVAPAQSAGDGELAKGIAQVQEGRLDDAVARLDGVVRRLTGSPERKPDLAQAYLWLGIAHAQLDAQKAGRASFREALTLDPRVSLAEGWPPKVARLFAAVRAEAAELPRDAESVYAMADRLEKAGRIDEAESTYRTWADLHRDDLMACGALANFFSKPLWGGKRKSEETLATLKRCVTIDDRQAPVHFALAAWYEEKSSGDPLLTREQRANYADLGLESADRALAIDRDSFDALYSKASLLLVKAALAKDDTDRAEYETESRRLWERADGLRKQRER